MKRIDSGVDMECEWKVRGSVIHISQLPVCDPSDASEKCYLYLLIVAPKSLTCSHGVEEKRKE